MDNNSTFVNSFAALNEQQFREKLKDPASLSEAVKDSKFEALFRLVLSFGSILDKELITGFKDNPPSEASQFRLAELYSKYEALVSSLIMILDDGLTSSADESIYEDTLKFTSILFEQAYVSLNKAENLEKSSNIEGSAKISQAKESIIKLQKEFLA